MRVRALNLIFPPQCLHCEALVPEHGTLCLACWQQVRFLSEPMCACCGEPFEYTIGQGALCGECMRDLPPYQQARAVFCYDEHSKNLVIGLKYLDQTYLAKTYASWLANAGRELIAASDLFVPVPLHYWRFVGRRYNQSALLAQALAAHCNLPCIPDALIRTRATLPQTGLTRSQREKNVQGAFTVKSRYKDALKGKNVLLIDDVLTTGTTLKQCAKILLKAGVANVRVLTLARTVR